MNSKNLENKVEKPEESIALCEWKECPERGQYIRCYFDLYKTCPKYSEHKDRKVIL